MSWRLAAVALVVLGAVMIGFNPHRWDSVLLDLPRGHGIHIRDLLGMACIAVGLTVMWHAPPRESSPREGSASG